VDGAVETETVNSPEASRMPRNSAVV